MNRIIEIPAAWRGPDISRSDAWVYRFSVDEIAEIDAALRHARAAGCTLATLTREAFPLPTLSGVIAKGREELEHGLGLQLYRGFPAAHYGKDDLRLIYWGLGKHIGTAVSQSMRGDLLGDVQDIGVDKDSPQGRGYTSRQQLSFHTDSCDVVGLFVLRAAKSGGLSMIGSSVTVQNEIATRRPDLLEVLYQPFYWSWQGQEPPGELPYYPQPIFTFHEGRFSCRYVRTHILSAQRFHDVPRLTPLQQEAIALLDEIAWNPELHLSMMFEPGDLQLLNNHVMLHSRTAFEDFDDPEKKRHLLRMWLAVPNSRALSPALSMIYVDQRAGAVRGGFPSRTGQHRYTTAGPMLD